MKVPEAPVDCYGEHDEGATGYTRFPTYRGLVEGHGTIWRWGWLNADTVNVDGTEVWCMFCEEIELEENGTIRGLAVSFNTLICLFQDVRRQLQ